MSVDLFPRSEADGGWERSSPTDAGLDEAQLQQARDWFADHVEKGRLLIVRGGRIVVEDEIGLDTAHRARLASAAKSVYSNVLGIAAEEGVVDPEGPVADVFPAMLDVPEDRGPKPGRYAFEKDAAITFRQLIANISGYMKPGEEPGTVFHYQTYGMNILTHAVAAAYGLYDVDDPAGSPGFGQLIRDKLAGPIGLDLGYELSNFELQQSARLEVFGYYCQLYSTARDFARLGWLWRHRGRWGEQQIVPQAWFDRSVQVQPEIRQHCPEADWRYGCGFWTNEAGVLWPDLPRSGFTASGAGGHYCSVFPEQDLVVVQNPGPQTKTENGDPARGNPELLSRILDALK